MIRPCFLVVDREHAGSISTRKLVIETAKFNVITAYSGAEAIEVLTRFPAVDGVVLDAGVHDVPCADLVRALKQVRAALPVVVVATMRQSRCEGADYIVESFVPEKLLGLLRSLVPQESAEVEQVQEQLYRDE